ncbi:MAG: hypothetical protein ISR55_00465 [Bacteroidetes bacterium]|nr:hypothetical protein [Bacteroidota bacterium]MBL6962275.1 hypothetical protein [Bacteroidota bacterium]
MKNLLFILISFSIISSNVNAQFLKKAKVVNHSGDALYVGWDNKIELHCDAINIEDIKVICSHGTVVIKDGLFIVNIPYEEGLEKQDALLTFIKSENGTPKKFRRIKYPIKYISSPEVEFGGKTSGVISADAVKKTRDIRIYMENCPGDLTYTIIKYQFLYKPKDAGASTFQVHGASLCSNCEKMLVDPKAGDIIIAAKVWADITTQGEKLIPGSLILTVE